MASRIGPETGAAIAAVHASRATVEQPFASCRNILGLSKGYSPELLERACAQANVAGTLPSYTGIKNRTLHQGRRRRARRPRQVRRAHARGGRLPQGRWRRVLAEEDFDLFQADQGKAMGDKLREMVVDPSNDEMSFEERMKVPVDAEASVRRDRMVAKLVREARFELPSACVEDVLYLKGRKPGKDRVLRRAECSWVDDCEVMIIISQNGCGKSFLSHAFGNSACRGLIPARYERLADMLDELNHSRPAADGTHYTRMDALKTVRRSSSTTS